MGEDSFVNNRSTAGTPAFRAPETLIIGEHLYSGKATDIWALGITLFSIVYGNVPYVADSVLGVYEKIKNDELQFPSTPHISDDLMELIGQMLKKNPGERITLPQIKVGYYFKLNVGGESAFLFYPFLQTNFQKICLLFLMLGDFSYVFSLLISFVF